MASSSRRGVSHRTIALYGINTPNGVVVDDDYRVQSHLSTDTKLGSKRPNWRNAVAKVKQAGTPYSRQMSLHGFITGTITGTYYPGGPVDRRQVETMSGQLFLDSGPGVPASPSMSHLDVQARLNFIKKAQSSQRAFQGGVFLGELREAVQMVTRPATALRRAISQYSADAKKAVRRGNGRNTAKLLSGTLLEAQLGWAPLVRDIDNGMAALADTNHIVPDVISGTGRDEWTGSHTTYGTVGTGLRITGFVRVRPRYKGRVRYLGCVGWESQNRAQNWQSHWGLTWRDFVPTVWELIPYSFLVDYFSNIGNVLDASCFGAVQLRWGVKSTVVETQLELGQFGQGWTSAVGSPFFGSASLSLSPHVHFDFTRGLVNSVSVGLSDIRFKIPGIGDWRKWANIAALAVEKSL